MNRLLAYAVVLLALPGVAHAQALVQPRSSVNAIADRIDEIYFSPERGRAIAADLRREAEAGDYDSLADARDLAQRLTERLRPLDRHFRVEWTAPRDAPVAPSAPLPAGEAARLRNHGFRGVEIRPGNVGVIDMRTFANIDFSDARSPARERADAALQFVASTDALILDLRENGGGSPSMVGYLASAFLQPGGDLYNEFRSRTGTRSERPEQPYPSPMRDKLLFVAVSARTGSAAEALAYTLQAADRAVVVGDATAGAANPAGPVNVGDGLSVVIPFATPVNPVTGGNWEETGVIPDLATAPADALDVAYRAALVRLTAGAEPTAEARWALETLDRAVMNADIDGVPGRYGSLELASGADGALQLVSGRRRPWRLEPLAPDLFADVDEPSRRVRILRAEGAVFAIEILTAAGEVTRYRRS